MSNKRRFKTIHYFVIVVGLIVFLRCFFIDYYVVSSESMVPAIRGGNLVFINAFPYTFRKHHMLSNINKNDIVVFNKPNWEINAKFFDESFYGEVYVKRCFGAPGDTVNINKPSLSSQSGYLSRIKEIDNINIFPHDTSFKWTNDTFGPFWVPKKNSSIKLNERTYKLYAKIIRYEGVNISFFNNTVLMNGRKSTNYTFKNNYYFMLGDNFYFSKDSRLWGLVPESNVLGCVFLVI